MAIQPSNSAGLESLRFPKPALFYRCLHIFLALVLLLSAALKSYEVATTPSLGTSVWSSSWFTVAVAEYQFLLGVWLLSGAWPRLSGLIALATFGLFSVITLVKALLGESSCGCFGTVAINPWYILIFDFFAVVALHRSLPAKSAAEDADPQSGRFAYLATGAVLIGLVGARVVIKQSPPTVIEDQESTGMGPLVLGDPTTWTGHRLPFFRDIDIHDSLTRDRWILVFHRRNCAACGAWLPQYIELAYQLANQHNAPRVALIDLPTDDDTGQATKAGSVCSRGTLVNSKHWGLRTPLFVALQDQRVSLATQSPELLLENPLLTRLGNGFATKGETTQGFSFPDYVQARRKLFLKEIACGPLSLVAILNHLGIPLTPEQIEELVGTAGSHGTDLLQLKQLAENYNLHALGVSTSISKLRDMKQAAIVHLDGVGFAAITGYTPDGLRVVYALRQPGIIPDDFFERSFGKSGKALLLSRSPLSPESLGIPSPLKDSDHIPGPVAALSKNVLSAGRISSYAWSASLKIRNAGTEVLQINNVNFNGALMKASVDQERVRPGDFCTLTASGKERDLGTFLYEIELNTNQAQNPSIKIPVRGYVEQPVTFPKPAFMLRGLPADREAWHEAPLVLARGIVLEQLRVSVSDKAPLKAQIKLGPKGEAILAVHWLGSPAPGWHHHEIKLTGGDARDAVPSTFHFAVEVIPHIRVFPNALTVRQEELTNGWSRRLLLEFDEPFDGRYTVSWSKPRFANAVRVEPSRPNDRSLVLFLSCPPNGTEPFVQTGSVDLLFRTLPTSSLRVPVRYLGKEGEVERAAGLSIDEKDRGSK